MIRYLCALSLYVMLTIFSPAHSEVQLDAVETQASMLNLDSALKKGDEFILAGELEAAEKIFLKILINHPNNAHATYQLGVISVRKGETFEGVAKIKRASLLAPSNSVYHMALASMYEFSNENKKALQEYQRVLEIVDVDTPDYEEAKKKTGYLKATLKARQGKFDAAASMFLSLTEQYPNDFLIRYSLGVAYMITGRLLDAEQQLLEAKQLNSSYGNIYLSLAAIYERKGDLSKAYNALAMLLEIDAPDVVLNKARVKMALIEGRLLLAEGNLSDALSVLDAALEIESNNLQLLSIVSGIYKQINDNVSEAFHREKIIALRPDAFAERLRLAEIYSGIKELDKAAQQLNEIIAKGGATEFSDRAESMLDEMMKRNPKSEFARNRRQDKMDELSALIDSDPDNLASWQRLAIMYYQNDQMDNAQQAFTEVLRLDPVNSRALLSLGSIFDRKGLYEKSLNYYVQAVSLEQDEQVVAVLLVEVHLLAGKMNYSLANDEIAQTFFSYVMENAPANYQARFFSGLIYLRQNSLPEALDAFQRIVQQIPGHMGARLNLALTYENMSEEEKAIEEYQDILRFKPPKGVEDQATQRIAQAEKRIRGFSGNVSYQMSYDDNSNLSSSDPDSELRTDLSLNIGYRYKAENGIRWYFSSVPVYSSYHNGQFDFLNTSTTLSATIIDKGLNYNAGLTNSNSRGLINSERASDSFRAFAEISSRVRLPVLTDWTLSKRVLSNLSMNMAYYEIDSLQSPFFSAFNYSAGVRMNQPVGERMAMALGYNYVLNRNMEVVGSDYAYRGHSVNVSLEKGVLPRVAVNVAYSLNYQDFLNPDAVTNFTSTRTNLQQSISVGSSYQMEKYFLLFANFSWSNNSSNLPIRFKIDAQDIIEGQLSPSLGDYSRGVLTMGLSMRL